MATRAFILTCSNRKIKFTCSPIILEMNIGVSDSYFKIKPRKLLFQRFRFDFHISDFDNTVCNLPVAFPFKDMDKMSHRKRL
jgi:hypothetical protein